MAGTSEIVYFLGEFLPKHLAQQQLNYVTGDLANQKWHLTPYVYPKIGIAVFLAFRQDVMQDSHPVYHFVKDLFYFSVFI